MYYEALEVVRNVPSIVKRMNELFITRDRPPEEEVECKPDGFTEWMFKTAVKEVTGLNLFEFDIKPLYERTKYSKYVNLEYESDKEIAYKFKCACGSEDCDTYITFKIDKEYDVIWVTFEKLMNWDDKPYSKNYPARLWNRITGATQLLFTGRIQTYEEITIYLDGLREFIDVLKEGERIIMDRERAFMDKMKKTKNKIKETLGV